MKVVASEPEDAMLKIYETNIHTYITSSWFFTNKRFDVFCRMVANLAIQQETRVGRKFLYNTTITMMIVEVVLTVIS